jgi:hypothetical protein
VSRQRRLSPRVEPAAEYGAGRRRQRASLDASELQDGRGSKRDAHTRLPAPGGRAASRPCKGSQPSVREAGRWPSLAGRAVKGVS